jgi:hypothetical protein
VNAALLKQHDNAVPPISDKSFDGERAVHGRYFSKAKMLIRHVRYFWRRYWLFGQHESTVPPF